MCKFIFLFQSCVHSVQYDVCLSVWDSALLIYHSGAHKYFFKGPLHLKKTLSHVTFSSSVIYPYTRWLFKGLIELFLMVFFETYIESLDLSQERAGVWPLSTTISMLDHPPHTTLLFSFLFFTSHVAVTSRAVVPLPWDIRAISS
jgi:hypothetical protein